MGKNILFLFLMMCVCKMSAQQSVYLRNGDVINGSVSDDMLSNTTSVKVEDGTVLGYDKNEVLRITEETSGLTQIPSRNRLRKGYRGSVDVSYHIVFYDDTYSYSYGGFFTTIHGGYVLPYLYIGGGGGIGFKTVGDRGYYYEYNFWNENYVRHRGLQICLPAFLNVRGYYPLMSGSGGPFLDTRTGFNLVNIGINCNSTSSFFTCLAIGWSWNSDKNSWNLSTGWQYETSFAFHYSNHLFFRFGLEF